MTKHRFIGWLNGSSMAFAETAEAAQAKVVEWVNGAHYRDWGTFPARVRVTTYAEQRTVTEINVHRTSGPLSMVVNPTLAAELNTPQANPAPVGTGHAPMRVRVNRDGKS